MTERALTFGSVAAAYEREGIMRTENALLNDSGGEGSPDPKADGAQGKIASVLVDIAYYR